MKKRFTRFIQNNLEATGLSKEKLAKRINEDPGLVSRVIRGEQYGPKGIKVILKIAYLFEIPVGALLAMHNQQLCDNLNKNKILSEIEFFPEDAEEEFIHI